MTLKVRPVGDRILVGSVDENSNKVKKGGIIIPDIAGVLPITECLVTEAPKKEENSV